MTGRLLRRSPLLFSAFCVCLSLQAFGRVRLDGLRNLKTGEPVPSVSLEVMDQGNLSTTSWQGHVTIVVCLASAQRHSELAAMESRDSGVAFASKGVKVYHLTTQGSDRELFRTFRTERRIEVPFIVDGSRAFTDAIGIIVLPTTLVLRKDGTLAHVISMHADDYRERLDAYVRHALGELSDAQLEEALKARPVVESSAVARAASHRSLARTMLERGDLVAAKAELIKALDLDPGNVQVRVDLADVELRAGKLEECAATLGAVLKAEPDQPRALQLGMFLLVRQERYEEAEPLLRKALATTPQPERIHAYLGLLYERTGKPDKALEHYKAALNRTIRERF